MLKSLLRKAVFTGLGLLLLYPALTWMMRQNLPQQPDRAPASVPTELPVEVAPETTPGKKYNKIEEFEGQKFVYINGKYYPHNPRNLYTLEGVETFVLERNQLTIEDLKKKNLSELQIQDLLKNSIKTETDPQSLLDQAQRAKRNMEEQRKLLDELSKEL